MRYAYVGKIKDGYTELINIARYAVVTGQPTIVVTKVEFWLN